MQMNIYKLLSLGSGGALHPNLGLQGQARSLSLSCIQGTGFAPGASIKGTSRGGYGLHLGLHLHVSSCDAELQHEEFASGLSTFTLLQFSEVVSPPSVSRF